jgi:drug/metabolite transporter (DMT)-like permease
VTSRQFTAFLLVAVIWGSSFLFIKVLIDGGTDAVGISAARTVLGVATLTPLAVLGRSSFPRRRRTWAALGGLGIINFALPWTLFSIGQRYVPSGFGAIMNAAQPLWAAALATLLIKGEAASRIQVAGLVIGLAGGVVLVQERIQGLDRGSLLGAPLMLLATLLYALSVVSIRRWLRDVPALPLTYVQIGVAAIALLPYALSSGAWDDASYGWPEWASMLTLGCLSSGVIAVLYMWLNGAIGPVRAAAVTYLMPPVGVALGAVLLDEAVTWSMGAGLALIIPGIALAQGLAPRRAREPAAAGIT